MTSTELLVQDMNALKRNLDARLKLASMSLSLLREASDAYYADAITLKELQSVLYISFLQFALDTESKRSLAKIGMKCQPTLQTTI